MGQASSHSENDLFISQLKESLKVRRIRVRKKDLVSFFSFIFKTCPWFPQEGSIDSRVWERVGDCLNDYYRVFGPETIPITTFNYYNLIRDVLTNQSDSPDIQRLCKEGHKILISHSRPPSRQAPVTITTSEKASSRPPSRAPSTCPSVAIDIGSDDTGQSSLYPNLATLTDPPIQSPHSRAHTPPQHLPLLANSKTLHNSGSQDDQLDPADQADLEEAAAQYNNPDWPQLTNTPTLPPFRPPSYVSTAVPPVAVAAPVLHAPTSGVPGSPTAPNLPGVALAKPSGPIDETVSLLDGVKTLVTKLSDLALLPPAGVMAFPVTRSQGQVSSNTTGRASPHPDTHTIPEEEEADSGESDSEDEEEESSEPTEPTYTHSYKRLNLKTIEKIKTAVANYGPTAPFTVALVESLSERWLTPSDWFFLSRAALSGGDNILWKSEYEDISKQFAERNARKASSKGWTLKKFLGASPYQNNDKQAQFPPGLLTQIQSAGLKAWKRLPQKGAATTSLAKIRQGPDESYSDFVSRLQETADRLFGSGEGESSFVKHLAYENANPACQSAIRPFRQKELCDYVRLCSGIGSAHAVGLAIGAALQNLAPAQLPGAQARLCYNCHQPGHLSRNCPQKIQPPTQLPTQPNAPQASLIKNLGPTTKCPRCKKGFHWASECRSRLDINGQPIIRQGNLNRGQPQGPTTGMNSGAPQFTPQYRQPTPALPVINHAATSQTSGEQQRAVQDWTSVPPPTQY